MKALRSATALAAVLLGVFASPRAAAHCDTLGGPVVQEARAALAKGDVRPVLKWVKADDEAAIRQAFARTLEVRRQSPAAAELADTYFFETLVRLHRAGEGEPYTGLRPGAPDEGIAAADAALENAGAANAATNRGASAESSSLAKQVTDRITAGLNARFERVVAARAHADDSVEAGRAYVAAYVDFIHYTEQLFALAESTATPHGHAHEP